VPAAPSPDLSWVRSPADPEAVVLVLHGGQEQSERATSWTNIAVVRMLPIALSIARAGRGRFAVVRIRYAVRGWNGVAARPLVDGRRALDDIAARFPGVPIALVGHSMGGRVALHLSGDERVTHIVGLAPWIGGIDRFEPHAELRLLVIHGLNDRITSPAASRQLVERLQARGRHASFVALWDEKHAMLHRWRDWDQLTAGFLRTALGPGRTVEASGTMSPVEQLGARASSEPLRTVI